MKIRNGDCEFQRIPGVPTGHWALKRTDVRHPAGCHFYTKPLYAAPSAPRTGTPAGLLWAAGQHQHSLRARGEMQTLGPTRTHEPQSLGPGPCGL